MQSDTACSAETCGADQRVLAYQCADCEAGTFSPGGDQTTAGATSCAPRFCDADDYVDTFTCTGCPAGTGNAAGNSTAGGDTSCQAILCGPDEYVSDNACAQCAEGDVNAGGDDASADDTLCDDICVQTLGLTCGDFEEAYIKPAQLQAGQQFGAAVDINGDWLIAGAPQASAAAGAVYIYHRDGSDWTQVAHLASPDAAAGQQFGLSVAINGDWAAIGTSDRRVYLFKRNATDAWLYDSELAESEIYGYGEALAMDDQRLVIGGGDPTKVYKYSGTQWTLEKSLIPSIGNNGFGRSVSIFSDRIVVGAPEDRGCGSAVDAPTLENYSCDGDSGIGAAFVFFRNSITGWKQEARLKGDVIEMLDWFGFRTAISNQYLAVYGYDRFLVNGDPNTDWETGHVFIFRRNTIGKVTTWHQVQRIQAPAPVTGQHFGSGLALEDSILAIGAEQNACGYDLEGEPLTSIGATCSNDDAGRGGVFIYQRQGSTFNLSGFMRPPYGGSTPAFIVALSQNRLAWGLQSDDSSATGVFNDQGEPDAFPLNDQGAENSGAVIVRRLAP